MEKIKLKINAPVNALDGAEILMEKLGAQMVDDGVAVSAEIGDYLKVCEKEDGYHIEYSILPEFFRGLAICVNAIRTGEKVKIFQHRQFDTCGAMFDMSRNIVWTVETAKDMLEYMAIMGLNMMMLYTEDTYEMDNYPMFGYMRGRYTKSELKEIDAYAASLGIELIPCIQTLGHLSTTLSWGYAGKFKNSASCLYIGKEETYQFIEEMFKTVKECFSSERIHVGLDEASDACLGKRFKEQGYVPMLELMTEHVNRVCALAEKYDLKPMMWSDMFFKNGHIGGDYDYTSEIPEGYSDKIPQNIELVYWDYGSEETEKVDSFLKRHKNELKRNTLYAGGIWSWQRATPNYRKTFDTADIQLASCKKNGVSEVFATVWFNTCALTNSYSLLPGLQMYAEHFYNETVSRDELAKMFKVCTSYSLDDFMLLGLDDFSKKELEKYKHKSDRCSCVNSSVQHFFNDILMGLFDKTLSGYNFKAHYRKYLKGYEQLGDMGKMNDLFEQTKLLTQICLKKSTIGPDITKAYKCGETRKLSKYLLELRELLLLYKEYHKISMKIWHKTNKPFGWEGCDRLISGMEGRIETAIYRLESYLDGTIEHIAEFEAEREYYNGCDMPLTEIYSFTAVTSTNVFATRIFAG